MCILQVLARNQGSYHARQKRVAAAYGFGILYITGFHGRCVTIPHENMRTSIRKCYDDGVEVGKLVKQNFAPFQVVFLGSFILARVIDDREQAK